MFVMDWLPGVDGVKEWFVSTVSEWAKTIYGAIQSAVAWVWRTIVGLIESAWGALWPTIQEHLPEDWMFDYGPVWRYSHVLNEWIPLDFGLMLLGAWFALWVAVAGVRLVLKLIPGVG